MAGLYVQPDAGSRPGTIACSHAYADALAAAPDQAVYADLMNELRRSEPSQAYVALLVARLAEAPSLDGPRRNVVASLARTLAPRLEVRP